MWSGCEILIRYFRNNIINPFEAMWRLYRVELRRMELFFTCLLAISNYSRWWPYRQIFNCQWNIEAFPEIGFPVWGGHKSSLNVLEKRKIPFFCQGLISGLSSLYESSSKSIKHNYMLRNAPYKFLMLNEVYLLARNTSPVAATSSRIWKSIFSPELVLTAAKCGGNTYIQLACVWLCKRYGNGFRLESVIWHSSFSGYVKLSTIVPVFFLSISWSPYLKQSATSW
jgi:hypothetical protein